MINMQLILCFNLPAAQAVGDVCVDDFDGDGVKDNDDHCPYVKHLSKTSFLEYFTVDLDPGHSDQLPVWRVAEKVCLALSRHNCIRCTLMKTVTAFAISLTSFNLCTPRLSYHILI